MQTYSANKKLHSLDRVGIACSSACAIHCLLLPIIAFASPSLSALSDNEWIHLGLLCAVVPVALFSFIRSKKVHAHQAPLVLGSLGIVVLISAVLLESLHIEIPYLEKGLTALGSLALVIGHIKNTKLLVREKKV